jgi:hypothetical protein
MDPTDPFSSVGTGPWWKVVGQIHSRESLKDTVEGKVEKPFAKINVRHVVTVLQRSRCHGWSRQPQIGGSKRSVQTTACAVVDQTNVRIFFNIKEIHEAADKIYRDWGHRVSTIEDLVKFLPDQALFERIWGAGLQLIPR